MKSLSQRSNLSLLLLTSILIILSLGGILDSYYLTLEHYSGTIPPCVGGFFSDCGKVLTSPYAVFFGIPLALLGMVHYSILTLIIFLSVFTERKLFIRIGFLLTAVGFVVSLYLMFLQVVVLYALCQYCMLSALISFILYFIFRMRFWDEYRELMPKKVEVLYRFTGKPAFFLLDPEWVHDNAMYFGNIFGSSKIIRNIFAFIFKYNHPALKQELVGLKFVTPVGMAAGYDYTASFPGILPSIGFGFETVGTITNHASEGNPKPRLGRLIKSRSLMVNKGFRNPGADAIVAKLARRKFELNLGISIGVTNTAKITTLEQAIEDVTKAFKTFEGSKVNNAYYELNISCPNLQTNVSFYDSKGLKMLLDAVAKLRLRKPLFIKMPIDKTNVEVKRMLDIITTYKIAGVIFGNLQKNRKDPALLATEVSKWGKGNFSGKPTFKRSNELIAYAYRHYGRKLIVIGCGGIFSPEDAYTKIKLGASVVQLITGMIFMGPQLIGQINRGLVELLQKDGYKHISEAIGADSK